MSLSEVFWAVLGALGGGALTIVGKLGEETLFKPITAIRGHLRATSFLLITRANYIASSRYENAPQVHQEIAEKLRTLAGDLRADASALPAYELFAFLRIVPPRIELILAAQCLMGLSNLMLDGRDDYETRHNWRKEIGRRLRIDVGT